MRFTRGYRSSELDDRRGAAGAGGSQMRGGLSGGGANLLGLVFQRFGLPGVLVVGALLYFTGGLEQVTGGGITGGATPAAQRTAGAGTQAGRAQAGQATDDLDSFVQFVFDDAQRTWKEQFAQSGRPYRLARLVLFTDRTSSACGRGEAAMGPFYCPGDEGVFIDLSFYHELRGRLGAPGDFAQAYVIAHELGHHAQHLLGQDARVHSAPEAQQSGASGLLVRLELQADCLAGVWAHGTARRDLLETGDIDEALNAASRIGDDTLQREATGVVRPESFTHGSSAQRKHWFQVGMKVGEMSACDTFGARSLLPPG